MLTLGIISESLVSFGIWIVSGVYHVAAWAFELFFVLCSNQLLDSSVYDQIVTNFYIVLGIIMLFFLTFTLLKGMVNPDDSKQGTSTIKKVIINLITSAIMMALLPTIFTFLFDFQTSVIANQNTIGKFFGYGDLNGTGPDNPANHLDEVRGGAYRLVNGVYTAFFNVVPESEKCQDAPVESLSNEDILNCQKNIEANDDDYYWNCDAELGSNSLACAFQHVDNTGRFGIYTNFSESTDDGYIDFNFLLSLVAGILLTYVGISYSIDMALRLVKLVFYQLIAPIPIFARVIPDTKLSSSFNQWLKVTLTCYFEVYVRIFVLYFVMFLCIKMLNSTFLSEDIYQYGSFFLVLFTKAFVLMGIIMFMRQAPKLLSEITGLDSGNMKLGIKDKLKDAGVFTAGAAIGGGITSMVRNGVNAFGDKNKWKTAKGFKGKASYIAKGVGSVVAGGASGGVRSGKAGWNAGSAKDMKAAASTGAKGAVDARDKKATYKARHGGNTKGVIKGHFADAWDTGKRWAGFNNIEELKEEKSAISNVTSRVDAVVDQAKSLINSEANKGKNWSFGIDAAASGGKNVLNGKTGTFTYDFTLEHYRNFSDAIDRARTTGTDVDAFGDGNVYSADELQRMFGKWESDYSKTLANQLFLSESDYSALKEDVKEKYRVRDASGSIVSYDAAKAMDELAILESKRSVAEAAKNELDRALGSTLVDIANQQSREINAAGGGSGFVLNASTVKGSLKVNDGGALDRLGAAAKERSSQIDNEISKFEQAEKDKNGK